MPLLFFIDRDIVDDPLMADVDDVVLSYTFFRCVLAFTLNRQSNQPRSYSPGHDEMLGEILSLMHPSKLFSSLKAGETLSMRLNLLLKLAPSQPGRRPHDFIHTPLCIYSVKTSTPFVR